MDIQGIMACVRTNVYAYGQYRSVYCTRSKRQMNDTSEEKTRECFFCDLINIFGITLKDRFVFAVEDNYQILQVESRSETFKTIARHKLVDTN